MAATQARTASWGWAISVVARRGPSLAVGLLTLLICVLNVTLRSTWWRYEWTWAWYQYQFGTILVGPIVSGVAYAWGATWRRARPMMVMSGRLGSSTATVFLSIVLPVVAAYLVVLAGVSAVVGATTGLWPDMVTLSTLAPGAALLAACVAIGTAAGLKFGVRAVAPLWSIGVFALLMASYMVIPDRFAKVGGASASLVGLQPRPMTQAGQVLEFVGVGLLALALCTITWSSGAVRRTAVAGAVTVLVGIVVLVNQPRNEFKDVAIDVTCHGTQPAICLAGGWNAAEADLRDPLARYDRSLAAAGLPRPATYTQVPDPTADSVYLDPVFVLRYSGDGPSDGLIINELIPAECWEDWDTEVDEAVRVIEDYLAFAWERDGKVTVSESEQSRLAAATETLRACTR